MKGALMFWNDEGREEGAEARESDPVASEPAVIESYGSLWCEGGGEEEEGRIEEGKNECVPVAG